MDRAVSHAELRELLGAYAVHALEPDEHELVAMHAVGCGECTDELMVLLDAAAALGAMALEEPADSVWEQLQRNMRAPALVVPVSAARVLPAAATVLPIGRARGRWKVAVAASAAAAIAVATTLAVTGSGSPSIAALANRAARETGATTVGLRGADGSLFAEAILTTSGQGYLRSTALAPLNADRTYQLWTIEKGQPVSVGLLGSSPKVTAFALHRGRTTEAIAISVEPAGGSSAPSSTPVAVAALG